MVGGVWCWDGCWLVLNCGLFWGWLALVGVILGLARVAWCWLMLAEAGCWLKKNWGCWGWLMLGWFLKTLTWLLSLPVKTWKLSFRGYHLLICIFWDTHTSVTPVGEHPFRVYHAILFPTGLRTTLETLKLLYTCKGYLVISSYQKWRTPPKTNMGTRNDGLEMVTPFKYGHFWYLC